MEVLAIAGVTQDGSTIAIVAEESEPHCRQWLEGREGRRPHLGHRSFAQDPRVAEPTSSEVSEHETAHVGGGRGMTAGGTDAE